MEAYGVRREDYPSEAAAMDAVFAAAMAKGCAGGDIFGLRLQGASFAFFRQQLARRVPQAASDLAAITSVFGPTLFIHLTRPDRLGQAISRLRAEQTGLWHRHADGSELERLDPRAKMAGYDAAAISAHIATHEAFDAAWEAWFAQQAMAPLRVTYDQLSADPTAVLASILSALDLDGARAQTVPPQTAKLADETSQAWRRRFEAEASSGKASHQRW